MSIRSRIFEMLLSIVILWLAFYLMLIVMTFNAGLMIATILGLTAGYTLFLFNPGSESDVYSPPADKCCSA